MKYLTDPFFNENFNNKKNNNTLILIITIQKLIVFKNV